MGSLNPDRQVLAQFTDLMFKHARRDAFISLRVFPDKGSKNAQPIDIEPIRVGDKDLLDITVIRATQAATWHEPAIFCPPVATFKNDQNAKTDNLCEGPCVSVECDQSPYAARLTLEALLGTATAVVASGGEWTNPETGAIEPKLHLHWRLKKPTSTEAEHELLRELRELATKLVGGDAPIYRLFTRSAGPALGIVRARQGLQKLLPSLTTRLILQRRLSTFAMRSALRHSLTSASKPTAGSSKPMITQP
jgi:hypothetical protein